MDIFEAVRLDHASILETLDELINQSVPPVPSGPVPGEEDWASLFHDLKLTTLAHDRAEEAVFYTLLRRNPGHSELEAIKSKEHHLTEELLEDLEEINPQDRTWATKLEVLKNHLSNHFDEEETNVFPLVKPYLAENEGLQLGHEFEELKNDIIIGAKYFPKGRSQFNPAGLDLER